MDYEDRIAKAEERAARATAYKESLQRVAIAEREIPGIWDTGEVTVVALSETYGISPVTVKRILNSAGRVIKRVKKLSNEERAEISALIQQGEHIANLAAKYKVSQNTVRRAGLESGVLVKGQRRPRRSDAEYEVIRAWDAETRQRFAGAGLYNLGLGLKAYDHKQKLRAQALARANEAKVDAQPTPPEGYDPPHGDGGDVGVPSWNEGQTSPESELYEGPDTPGNPTPESHPEPQNDGSPADTLPDAAPDPEETPNYNF